MTEYIAFIVIGLTVGAVYGLAATGLVLTYKASGIFNFAHGSLAVLGIYLFSFLHVQHNVAWPIAVVVCLFVAGPTLGLLLEYLGRVVGPASTTVRVTVTLGLILLVIAIGNIWYRDIPTAIPQFLPTGTAFDLFGAFVVWYQAIEIIFSVGVVCCLYYFFRVTRLGLAMRAVVDTPQLVSMTGESATRVRRWAWVIGSTMAVASGLLLGPSLGGNATILTLFVVQAFGAAAFGYFSNLPLTYLGALAVGVIGALVTKFTATVPSLSNAAVAVPFVFLIVTLIVTPQRYLAERPRRVSVRVPTSWYAPIKVRLVGWVIALAVLAVIPKLVGLDVPIWSDALVTAILVLSLGVVVRTSGQIALCQYAFAAVGAAAFGHLAMSYHVPWLLALLLAGLIAVPVGALVAIPAIRLTGVFLGLATLGFGIVLEQIFYTQNWMFGQFLNGLTVNRPGGNIGPWQFGSDVGFYYVTLCALVLAVAVVIALEHGRIGRLLRGLRDSPLALTTQGATINVTKVLILCISAFLAGVSGALLATLNRSANSGEFPSFSSITLFVLVIIVVMGNPWYALVAAMPMILLPVYLNLNGQVSSYLSTLFGVGAIMYGMPFGPAYRPPSVPRRIKQVLERLGGPARPRVSLPTESAAAVSASPQPRRRRPHAQGRGLEVAELEVRYGGVVAVAGATFAAPLGRITGLIGPNGAGKTTIFNACSGIVRATHGSVTLNGIDLTRRSPQFRARSGLGRTFQRVELFDSLSVRENVYIGAEAALAGPNPVDHIVSRPAERAALNSAVDQALEATRLTDVSLTQCGLLSTGKRRLVELARVLAGQFDILMLDEPSSGLDSYETAEFGQILSDVVARDGTGILLIEHDMTLVQAICNEVYLLDFGEIVFRGTPSEMAESTVVRHAYLGESLGSESLGEGART